MPEISLLAALPAAPAAPGRAAASATGVTAAQPTDAQADGSTHFLAQLKSALANLASAALPVITSASPTQGLQALAGQTAPIMAHKPEDTTATADHESDVMPEMLAALGFVLVPSAFQTPLTPQIQAAAGTEGAAAAAALAAAQPAPTSPSVPAAMTPPMTQPAPALAADGAPQPASPPDPSPSGAAAQTLFGAAMAQQPSPAASTPRPQLTAAQAARLTAADAQPLNDVAFGPTPGPAPQHTLPVAAAPHAAEFTSPSATQTPAEAAALAQALQNATRAAPADAPSTQKDTPTPVGEANQVLAGAAVQSATQNAFGHSAGGDGGHAADKRSAASLDSAAAQESSAVLDRSFLDVSSAAPAASTLPASVQATQVVSQIAHQADLYRQPGSKSIRIQLHPEDLGGVDVTLRYSAAGGIQLHINAEHASTGHLVQAGWTELRDALATQGINPDRMVMSVTAPNGSGGLSFSSGNGSGRPDPGVDSFTQGQSSGQQQRDSQQQQPTNRSWNPLIDPIPSLSDEGTRVAAASAARIDYRV